MQHGQCEDSGRTHVSREVMQPDDAAPVGLSRQAAGGYLVAEGIPTESDRESHNSNDGPAANKSGTTKASKHSPDHDASPGTKFEWWVMLEVSMTGRTSAVVCLSTCAL